MLKPTIVIIGGGIAGLAAAVRLIQLGLRPIVLEKRPFLGGRAFSFLDSDSGLEIDNGQHVFIGACREFQQYVKDIDAWDQIRLDDHLAIPILKHGQRGWLRARKLPGFLANLSALIDYRHVSLTGKLRILWGLLHIRFTRLRSDLSQDQITFEKWLLDHGQTNETIQNFWNLIVLPSLNDDVSVVSAYTSITLFKVALLGDSHNPAIGIPMSSLSNLIGENARKFIESHDGEIRTDINVQSLSIRSGSVTGVETASGDMIEGNAVISAVPAAAMLPFLPSDSGSLDNFFSPAESISTSPIVAIHIWYDRPVMQENFAAMIGSSLQWVFNDTSLKSRDDDGGQHVVISLSGAWVWKHKSKHELREIFTAEMAKVFPSALRANISRFSVVKMLDATLRVTPGSERFRLPQRTTLSGFYLAGDWTDTGWPSTMESAVRSGNFAAKYIVEDICVKTG